MDPSLLEPFECRVVPNAFSQKKKNISHFRLVRQPPSIKTLVDLFQGDELRFVWTSDCSFLRLLHSWSQVNRYGYKPERPDNYKELFGVVGLGDRAGQQYILCIYASTPKTAKACLESLCAIDDEHFVSFSNSSWRLKDEEVKINLYDNVVTCPHSPYALELLGCSSSKRPVSFDGMAFRGSQTMPLVKPGGSLHFHNCWFVDGDGEIDGHEFVNALNAFQDTEKLKRLTCVFEYPFLSDKLWETDAITRIEHIVLDSFSIDNETAQNVGKVEKITFVDCSCGRGGSEGPTLLENLASSTKLRSLNFLVFDGDGDCIGWNEGSLWMDFFHSLRQQRTLERLVFSGYEFRSNEIEELLRSIHHIPTLRHLSLSLRVHTSEQWNNYLSILSRNRYLRSLDFQKILEFEPKVDQSLMQEITRSLSRFIRQNQSIEMVEYNETMFDQEIWNANVVPLLDCNRYRPKFLPIPSIRKNRPAILGASLASLAAKPHLIWMLVKTNQDTVAHRLENALRRQSPSPRKRQRI